MAAVQTTQHSHKPPQITTNDSIRAGSTIRLATLKIYALKKNLALKNAKATF